VERRSQSTNNEDDAIRTPQTGLSELDASGLRGGDFRRLIQTISSVSGGFKRFKRLQAFHDLKLKRVDFKTTLPIY
jgi:hypothetical protein